MARLYPVYARDVLSFLTFAQLQECRQVSRSVNATIAANPVSIPARRRLNQLSISVGSAIDYGRPLIDTEGYATRRDDFYKRRQCMSGEWRMEEWKSLQDKWGCCQDGELEKLALGLVGERMCPAHPADSLVKLLIRVRRDSQSFPNSVVVLFFARNEMTAGTAFGVLHLLDHLHHAYFVQQNCPIRLDGGAPLNPSIYRLLSGDYGHPFKLHFEVYWPVVRSAVDALIAEVAHLKVREVKCPNGWSPEVVFGFALGGGHNCEQVTLQEQNTLLFDAALEYFQNSAHRIGRDSVKELVIRRDIQSVFWPPDGVDDYWPRALPAREAMESEPDSKWHSYRLAYGINGTSELYRLRGGMANLKSGERFDVVVVFVAIETARHKLETVTEMRLRSR